MSRGDTIRWALATVMGVGLGCLTAVAQARMDRASRMGAQITISETPKVVIPGTHVVGR